MRIAQRTGRRNDRSLLVYLLYVLRLQNSRFFSSKSVNKSVKRGARVLRARSARASHARGACEARVFLEYF